MDVGQRLARRVWPAGLPLALALVFGRSAFRPGYVLSLDIAFGPLPAPLRSEDNPVVSGFLLGMGHTILGGQLVGKVYLLATLFIAGFAPMLATAWAPWYARCAACLIGVCNPWVYDRIASGQYGVVVAGTGLMVWIAAYRAMLVTAPRRRAVVCGLVGVVLLNFDLHVVGPLVLLGLAGFLFNHSWQRRDLWEPQIIAATITATQVLVTALRFFASTGTGTYTYVAHFSDFASFQTVSSSLATVVQRAAGLYGFWGERLGGVPSADGNTGWWVPSALILTSLTLLGGIIVRRYRWLLATGLVGLAVTVSTSFPVGLHLAEAISRTLPVLSAYREPAKWDALWLAAVCICPAALAVWLRGRRLAALALLVSTSIGGAAIVPVGVVLATALPDATAPVVYPESWLQAADYLQRNAPASAAVISLPWHEYLRLGFSSGRVVMNPSMVVFRQPLIAPDDPEVPGDRAVDLADPLGAAALTQPDTHCALVAAMRRANIHWAVLLDAADAPAYLPRLVDCGFRPARTYSRLTILSDTGPVPTG